MARLHGLLLVLGCPQLRELEGCAGCGERLQAERSLRGYYCPVCVIVAPEDIYVGRVCPPGPVGSMLLVWTDLVKARRCGRRGAYVPFRGTDAGGRSGLYSAAGCTRTHFRITNLSWLAVNGEKSSP